MMPCNSSIIACGVIGGACYVIPKALTYLCTKPDNPDASFWSRLREKMDDLQERTRSALGERLWFYGRDVVADNAWISAIAIRCLTSTPFDSMSKCIYVVTAFCAFSAQVWLVRHGISKQFPQLAPFVGNRNY